MLSLKNRRRFLGLSLATVIVALITSALLSRINEERKLELNKAVGNNVEELPVTLGTPLNESDTRIEQQGLVVNSTPQEHDQLIISAALKGTSIDGALKADSQGNLVLDLQVRDFFDYFLSIADDVGPEQAIAEIQRYSQQYLPEPANAQALELLGNYLRYKQVEFQIQQAPLTREILQDSDALVLLRSSFNQLKTKRQSLFSAEQDKALFSLEDSFANHTLSTLELMADDSTDDEYKKQQLAVLEAQLPPALSESFAQTRVDREQQQDIELVLNSSADDTQAYEQLSRKGISQSQMDLIVQRRQQQRHFDDAYARYSAEKQALDTDTDDYQSRLSGLQARFFLDPESITQAKLRDLNND